MNQQKVEIGSLKTIARKFRSIRDQGHPFSRFPHLVFQIFPQVRHSMDHCRMSLRFQSHPSLKVHRAIAQICSCYPVISNANPDTEDCGPNLLASAYRQVIMPTGN
jgi:hypothetical protein